MINAYAKGYILAAYPIFVIVIGQFIVNR